jgi:insulysin
MANLNCTITSIESGLNLQISGFSEKSKLFLSKVLNEMTNLNIDEQIFKTQKESLTNSYQNAALDTPISQGIELMRAILNKNFVTNEKRAQAIKNVTKESLNRFANNLFNKTYIEGVIYGNITSDEASQMVAILQKSLNSKPLPEKEIPKKMVLKLNNELGPFSILKKIEQPGNANFLLIENGCYSIKKRCLLQILSRGIQEPFFSELRTKQQTGYIVASDDQDVERELIQFFIVQSNTHDPSDLNSRFELFIENILRDLETSTFTIDRFETIKNSLIDELSKPMNNLKEMANVLDSLAFDFDGDFDFINKRIKSTQDASYDEFVSFAKDFLGRENKRRLSIQIQGSLPKSNELHYTQVPSIQRLRSLGEFLSKNENICNNEE